MKELFSINSDTLSKYLKVHIKNAVKNTSLPVLENFRLELKGNNLTLVSENLITRIESKLIIQRDLLAEDEILYVNANMLTNGLKLIKNQTVTFSRSDYQEGKATFYIKHNNGKSSIGIENFIDEDGNSMFPQKVVLEDKTSFVFSHSTAEYICNNILQFTGTDDLIPVMMGVNIQINENLAEITATDAHNLASIKEIIKGDDINIVISKDGLNALKMILPLYKDKVNVSINKTNIVFEISNYIITSRLVDGTYPNFKAVLPQSDKFVSINKKELQNVINRSLLFANKNTSKIVLDFKDNSLEISSEDIDFSNSSITKIREIQYKEPFELKIGFNAKILSKCLNSFSSDIINFEMAENNQPLILKGDNKDYYNLIMPVKIN